MKKFLEILVPETNADRVSLTRALKKGLFRRLYSGVYTPNMTEDLSVVSRRNWIDLVGAIRPGLVVSYRSAVSGGLGKTNELFLSGPKYETLHVPGFVVQIIKGPGPIEGDTQLGNNLFLASRARALLEILMPNRAAKEGLKKGLDPESTAEILGKILSITGAKGFNRVRDDARKIAPLLGAEKEFLTLNSLCGQFLGLHTDSHPPKAIKLRRFQSYPADARRRELFQTLQQYLLVNSSSDLSRSGIKNNIDPETGLHVMPFIDAYFSNYIEGTKFEVAEAVDIVRGKTHVNRPEDAKDIIATYVLLKDLQRLGNLPQTGNEFISLLSDWHQSIMAGRPEKSPGEFKKIPNMAGIYRFVEPDLVEGTLRAGFDLSQTLESPNAKAFFLSFVVAEVHPFMDGNGRLSRALMNAILVTNGYDRAIIPTVFRDDYLTAISALSNNANPEPFIKMLSRAQQWTSHIPDTTLKESFVYLRQTNAFKTSREGLLLIPEKRNILEGR